MKQNHSIYVQYARGYVWAVCAIMAITLMGAQQARAAVLTLSESNLTVGIGQTVSVTAASPAGNIGTVTVPINTNPASASASVAGTSITMKGIAVGGTIMTVCASNIGCATLYVTVGQGSAAVTTPQTTTSNTISFSKNIINTTVGQQTTVAVTGPGDSYVSGNTNPLAVSANVVGTVLTVTGKAPGSAIVSACSAGNNLISCGNITVNVDVSTTTVTSTADQKITFGTAEADLTVGQRITVPINNSNPGAGSPIYSVTNNSYPAAVTASIVDSSVMLTANLAGGANITICQIGQNCGNLYVYVSSSTPGITNPSSGASTATTVTTLDPVLSSFSVTSNTVNNAFMDAGDALTFTFSLNRSIQTPFLMIGGSRVTPFGSGSGPYTAIYTMKGSEPKPLTAVFTYTTASGVSKQMTFTVGAQGAGAVTPAPVSTGTTVSSAGSSNVSGSHSYTRYLYMGMTKLNVSDPDVKALQAHLKELGIYNGPITGYFGDQTKTAVQAYQKKNSLDPIGVVGAATRVFLNKGI